MNATKTTGRIALGALLTSGVECMYRAGEGIAWVLGRPATQAEYRALRRATQLHAVSGRLAREGRTDDALRTAQAAFEALKEGDPRRTFPQLGVLVARTLDDLAKRAGAASRIRPELLELHTVLTGLRNERSHPSYAWDEVIKWLESRVDSQ